MTRCIKVLYKNPLRTIKNSLRKVLETTLIHLALPGLLPLMEADMREKQIESRLAAEVKKRGGIAVKFVSPSFAGMPDRLVLLPDGHVAFAELKAPGRKPRPLQLARHRLLKTLGFRVYVIDDAEQIGGILDEI